MSCAARPRPDRWLHVRTVQYCVMLRLVPTQTLPSRPQMCAASAGGLPSCRSQIRAPVPAPTPPHPTSSHVQAAFGKDPNVAGFKMRVDGRQMEVPARVLPNPRLTYGSPANFDPKVGVLGAQVAPMCIQLDPGLARRGLFMRDGSLPAR